MRSRSASFLAAKLAPDQSRLYAIGIGGDERRRRERFGQVVAIDFAREHGALGQRARELRERVVHAAQQRALLSIGKERGLEALHEQDLQLFEGEAELLVREPQLL